MRLAAITEAQVVKAFANYRYWLEKVSGEYAYITKPGYQYRPTGVVARDMKYFISNLANSTIVIAQWISETREIPSGKAKKLEMALRVLMSIKRGPNDPKAWWEKNVENVNFILETENWPEKSEEKVYVINGIRVHDSIHLPPQKLDITLKVIDSVTDRIKSHGYGQILYGDILIVGQLMKSNVLAWYYKESDNINIRPFLKVGMGVEHNLAHEIGHRQWYKFLSMEQQKAWRRHYTENSYRDFKWPEVGDVIPGTDHTIVKIEGLKFFVSEREYVDFRKLHEFYKWPTPYSSTSPEEFFAECFALYIYGKLDEPFKGWFEGLGK